jgi:hypothetical protein
MTSYEKQVTQRQLLLLQDEAVKRFNDAFDSKDYDGAQVAKIQRAFLDASIDLVNYSLMLDDRNTLQAESFLVEKIAWIKAELENATNRIKIEASK